MDDMSLYDQVAEKLNSLSTDSYSLGLGFDGYVDEIIAAVDSRDSAEHYQIIRSIPQFGNRILAAAGKSTNIELVTNQWKLGGNGPILGNSIAHLGVRVDYIGALGYPEVHKVFSALHKDFKYISIDEPGHTMAVEFEDGKIMLGRFAMKDMDWNCLEKHVKQDHLKKFFYGHKMVGLVNWTQTPHMSSIWEKLLSGYLSQCPKPSEKPFLFVDVADPQKRSKEDILNMLDQLSRFESFYKVILGLNEKESTEIARALDISYSTESPEKLQLLTLEISKHLKIYGCVVHPVKYAVCAIANKTFYHEGPYIANPLISTGAGDHFNAGFCFGQILGLTPEESLMTGVANSGFYVRTAKSATKKELAQFIHDWKNKKI